MNILRTGFIVLVAMNFSHTATAQDIDCSRFADSFDLKDNPYENCIPKDPNTGKPVVIDATKIKIDEPTLEKGIVKIEWSKVEGADGYVVYYANKSFNGVKETDLSQFAKDNGGKVLNSARNVFRFPNLTMNTEFFFRIAPKKGFYTGPASDEKSVKIGSLYFGQPLVNDTGVTKCGNYTSGTGQKPNNKQDCDLQQDSNNHPIPLGQDGHFKTDGVYGLKLTKLDNSGNTVTANHFCVRDEHTGLVWATKRPEPDTTNSKDYTFTYYNAEGETAALKGKENGGTCSGFSCDNSGFITAMNNEAYCGIKDWRLPTANELLSIVDLQHHAATAKLFDLDYFPFKDSRSNIMTSTHSPNYSGDGRYLLGFSIENASGNLFNFSSFLKTTSMQIMLVSDSNVNKTKQ